MRKSLRLIILSTAALLFAILMLCFLIPQPASRQDLLGCSYTLYTSFRTSATSGIIVSKLENGNRKYFALTAAHVIDEINRLPPYQKLSFGVPSKADPSKFRRLERPAHEVSRAIESTREVDIGCFDLSDAIVPFESNEGVVKAIDLSSKDPDLFFTHLYNNHLCRGVGVACTADYQRLGICKDTPLLILCGVLTNNLSNAQYDWEPSLTILEGSLLKTNVTLRTISGFQKAHVFSGHLDNGNSGGAVFAIVKRFGREYPYLIGVTSGIIPGRKDECAIAPIDPLMN